MKFDYEDIAIFEIIIRGNNCVIAHISIFELVADCSILLY
jgi:hypothetical protein